MIRSKIGLTLFVVMVLMLSINVCAAQEIDSNRTDTLEIEAPETDYSQEVLSVENSNESYSASSNSENEVLSDAYLIIDNDADKEDINVGDYVTWTFEAKNLGPDVAKNTKMHIKLADGLKYVKHTATKGVFDPKTGIWDMGNLSIYDTVELFVITKALTLGEKVTKAFITSDTLNSNNETYEEEEIDVEEGDDDSAEFEKVASARMHETGNPIFLILVSLFAMVIPIFKR